MKKNLGDTETQFKQSKNHLLHVLEEWGLRKQGEKNNLRHNRRQCPEVKERTALRKELTKLSPR